MPADGSNLDASLVQEEDAEEDTDMQNKMRDIMSDAAVTSFEVEDSEKEDLDAGFDFTLDARSYGKAGEEDDEGETGPLVIEWGSKIVIKPLVKGELDDVILHMCQNACASAWLDNLVLFCIIMNTAMLALVNPATTYTTETLGHFMTVDIVLTVIFSVEMFIRIIAMGFYDKESTDTYLNDPWNQLDFFVVLTSWLNVLVEVTGMDIGIEMSSLRALRILRVLRALKFFAGIRTILSTIGQALPYAVNVVAFIMFLMVVCGIIGVQMFRGKTRYRCEYGGFDLQAELNSDKWPLVPDTGLTVLNGQGVFEKPAPLPNPAYEYPIGLGIWYTYCKVDTDCPLFDAPDKWNRTQRCVPSLNPAKNQLHFDTIFDAWIALFINMANLYWWETAHRAADTNDGMGSAIAWGYGLFNVFFLTYVSVNMFVAVITTVFADVRSVMRVEDEIEAARREEAGEVVEVEEKPVKEWEKPCYFVAYFGGEGLHEEHKEDPEDRNGLIWQPMFDTVIMSFIGFNTITLSMDHHDPLACDPLQPHPEEMCQSADHIWAMKFTNYIFNAVFTFECIAKVLGMGFLSYLKPAFNKLDFFIVVTSALDMIGDLADGALPGGGVFKLFRVFRLFRVLRVARILYRNENLKRVLITVFGSGGAIANLVLFIMFAVLLAAIMGMHLMGGLYIPTNMPDMARCEQACQDGCGGACERASQAPIREACMVTCASVQAETGAIYGDNSGTLWGRIMGNGTYVERMEGAKLVVGYNVTEFIVKGLMPRRNFEDFPRAFLLSFQIMTGDDWVNQLSDYMEVKSRLLPVIIFGFTFAFTNYILLSLFIAVILENFEVAEVEKMKKQMEVMQNAEAAAAAAATKPKAKWPHRLVWLFGGEGAYTTSICPPHCGYEDDPRVNPDDGEFLKGEKWYNDDKALFLFSVENPVRVKFGWLVENQYFDNLVLFAILLGTLLLAIEGPPNSIDKDTQFVFDRINDGLFAIFIVEFVGKLIAYGFIFTPNAYLKDSWNKLDFTVILGSIVNYMGGEAGLVRLLRCLRPLRIINRNASMKVIITAVVDSLAVNLGVLALAGLGILIFAILGVNLLGGKFFACNCSHAFPLGITAATHRFDDSGGYYNSTTHVTNAAFEVMTKRMCVGPPDYNGTVAGVDPMFPNAISTCYWDNRPYNFDTCGNAMMALFTASTLAGWTDIMEIALDSRGIDDQPVFFSAWYYSIYFLIYVMLMAFFVTNLFIGVLIDFMSNSDGSALLTEEQQKLLDLKKFQRLHRPEAPPKPPANSFRCFWWGVVESAAMDKTSNFVIVFNVVVMMCEYEDMSKEWSDALEFLNYVCLIFFTVEMAVKLIAYMPRAYWADPWSKFDATVVLLSWLAIILDLGSVQAVRAMRAFRIILVLKGAKGIRSLFQTLMLSIAPGANIAVLMLLLYAFYSIAGMQLFGDAPLQDIECDAYRSLAIEYDPATTPWYCMVGAAPDANAGQHWSTAFGAASGGRPGHMLMGANRQYTHHSSFRSFGSAMTLLFQCAAGQDWKFVAYAMGGEPGQPGASDGVCFIFFCSFFFLSNYILLNLFIASILDNFAASMREQELDISEQDFEMFKFLFRTFSSDETPEVIPFGDFWNMLVEIGQRPGHDDEGEELDNSLAPPPISKWSEEEEQLLFYKIQASGDTMDLDGLREFINNMYVDPNSPISTDVEPGHSAEEYLEALLSTPGAPKSARFLEDCFLDDQQLLQFDAFTATQKELEPEPVTTSIVVYAMRTLRFRTHYEHLRKELEYHGHGFLGEDSTLRYDHVLQALVNVKMGDAALSLEEQLKRGHSVDMDEDDDDVGGSSDTEDADSTVHPGGGGGRAARRRTNGATSKLTMTVDDDDGDTDLFVNPLSTPAPAPI